MNVTDLASYIQTGKIVNKPIWTKINEMQQKVSKMIVKFVKQAVIFEYVMRYLARDSKDTSNLFLLGTDMLVQLEYLFKFNVL